MKLLRYSRQMKVNGFGVDGQVRLSKARILVVGAGGLGAACLPYLAGAGIGHICIMDEDTVELSNLHRQVIYQERDIGKYKATAAMLYLSAQNEQIEVECILEKIGAHNALSLAKKYDVIVDCTDNYNAKYAMSDACEAAKIPMISASIEGMSGYLGVFAGDELPSYRALFNEPALNALNCADSGVLGTVAGMFGMMQAHEVIKHISGAGQVADKVIMLDLYDFSLQKIQLPTEYQSNFKPFAIVDLAEAVKTGQQLVDVRALQDFEDDHFDSAASWPVTEISKSIDGRFEKNNPLVLYCATGARAENAAIRLQQAGFDNLALLSRGIR